jgi:nitrite reductase (cytochrome c-552)
MSSKTKNWLLFALTGVAVFLLGLLASNITNRKAEGKFAYMPKIEIDQNESDNAVWGEYFPREYQSSLKTKDTTFASYNSKDGYKDMLEESPRLVVLWAGYGFAKDYNAPIGHEFAIEDIQNTLRTGAPTEKGDGPMPATCWTCKSPDVPRLMNEMGISEFYKAKWGDLGHEVTNSVGCADCHNSETMALRISRPALIEAYEAMGEDISQASHQEMRSLVCAQCHVEYYFNKNTPGKEGVPYLTFPWKVGLSVEAMEAYYDAIGFADWTHAISKAPMLKAQHPGYEIFKTSVHAKRGVSCADCHMPYKTEGGQKFTDHHIQSPLANPANSCQVCHREETADLISDVYERQIKVKEQAIELEKILVRAHVEAGKAWELGATEEQMKDILQDIRHAQWRWDYAVASHGGSFHNPLETSRVITSGTRVGQEARLKLAKLLYDLGHTEPVPYPAIDTKEMAQAYIGLDAEKMQADKEKFKEDIVPTWMKNKGTEN